MQGNAAGLWLERCPTQQRFTLDSKHFTTQLRYRFRLPIPSITRGSHCSCRSHPKLDAWGYHLSSLCGKDGFRTATHNAIAMTINQCCHANGILTQLEPRNLFRLHNPDDGDRPDIILMNAPGFKKTAIAVDVRVSHPISTPSKRITRAQAEAFDKGSIAARKSLNEKNRKYKEKCEQVDIGFNALIFESTGRPLQETIDFVEKIVKNSVAVKGLDGHATTRYWMSALSFAIQKAVSEAILKRSLLVNSAQTLGAHSKDKSSQHIHSADTINGRKHFRSTTFHPKFNNSRFPTYDNNSTPYDQSQNTPHLSSTVVTSIESVHDDDSEQDNDQDVKDNSFELDSIDD